MKGGNLNEGEYDKIQSRIIKNVSPKQQNIKSKSNNVIDAKQKSVLSKNLSAECEL